MATVMRKCFIGPILTQSAGVGMQMRNPYGTMGEHQQAERAAGDPTAFPTMKTVITTDWAPHIETTARRLAQVCAFVYCLGWATGAWLHRLNDRLAEWAAGHYRDAADVEAGALALQQFRASGERSYSLDEVMADLLIQPLAAVAAPANIAPPRTGIIHISDPMALAVRLVRDGKSQRLAAYICGVSRTSLQRALKK
jgi:hypothetical protein